MSFDWDTLADRLRTYPPSYHQFLAPCPHHRITAVEEEIGHMPVVLRQMLEHFNGAKLFIATGPMLRVFGLSTIPPLPPLEWGEDWYIDKFTPKWRASGPNRNGDWAIGMTNYGGLLLFSESRGIKEWDTGESRWLFADMPFDEWIEKVIKDGEVMMAELKLDRPQG